MLMCTNIYYYSNQPYWVEKDGLNLKVKTRQFSGGEFQSGDYESGSLTHNSGGSFFKDNYFICWDEQYIDVVALSNSSMSINSFNTLDENQGGNQGASLGFSTSAVFSPLVPSDTIVPVIVASGGNGGPRSLSSVVASSLIISSNFGR